MSFAIWAAREVLEGAGREGVAGVVGLGIDGAPLAPVTRIVDVATDVLSSPSARTLIVYVPALRFNALSMDAVDEF